MTSFFLEILNPKQFLRIFILSTWWCFSSCVTVFLCCVWEYFVEEDNTKPKGKGSRTQGHSRGRQTCSIACSIAVRVAAAHCVLLHWSLGSEIWTPFLLSAQNCPPSFSSSADLQSLLTLLFWWKPKKPFYPKQARGFFSSLRCQES